MVATEKGGTDMSTITTLDQASAQITTDKLETVRQRRRWLLVVRAAAACIVIFLSLLLVGALIDKFWKIGDGGRIGFSVSMYGAVLVALGVSLLPLFRRWGLSEAARVVEEKIPALRNKLLSAVELNVDSEDPRFGSLELRQALQSEVANQVREVQLPDVLPWSRLLALVVAMLGSLLLVGTVAMVPGWNLSQHMFRMLLPVPNLSRPSLAEVRILAPEPASTTRPLREKQLFRASLRLPENSEATLPDVVNLQLRSSGPELFDVALVRDSTDPAVAGSSFVATYSAAVILEHPQIDYRVVSPLGETPWHTLKAFPRPVVEQFTKIVTPPVYADRPSQTTETVEGDLEVVAGSQVGWKLKTNVPLQGATLRWLDDQLDRHDQLKQADQASTIPFTQDGSGQWQLQYMAETTRRFQIDLQSNQGLASSFPKTFRLTVRPDQAPKVVWLEPKVLSRVIRPRSAAKLKIELQDEYPLQRLEQWTRVNRDVWRKEPLNLPETEQASLEWTWEMATLRPKIGDYIETKLVAVDRKDQVGESPTIEWMVSGTELDSAREPATLARMQMFRILARLTPLVHAKQEKLRTLTEDWRKSSDDPARIELLQREIDQSAQDIVRQLLDIRQEVVGLMVEVHNPASSEEVMLLLDTMSTWQKDAAVIGTTMAVESERETTDTGHRRDVTERFRGRYEHVLYGLQRLPINAQHMASHDLLADLSRDLMDAAAYQEELLRDWAMVGTETWQREQRVLSEHLSRVAKDMNQHASYLPDGPANGLRERGQIIERMAERALHWSDTPNVEVQKVTEMSRELQQVMHLNQVYSGLPDELNNSRRELFNHSFRTRDIVLRAMQQWQYERPFVLDRSVPTSAFFSHLEVVRQRRETRYQRGDHSGAYAADLGMALRAIEHQIQLHSGNSNRIDARLQEIADAVGVIEAGQKLENAAVILSSLTSTERFAATGKWARTENPRLLDTFGQQLEWAHDDLRQVNVANEIAQTVNAIRWSTSAQAAGQKISPRRWDTSTLPVSAAGDLESVRTALLEQVALLAPEVQKARELLASLAPPIRELAEQSAASVQESQAATKQLQADVDAAQVSRLPERLNENRDRQAEVSRETSRRLQEALFDHAAAQDLRDPQQLQAARTADLAREWLQTAEQSTDRTAEDAQQLAAQKSTGPLDSEEMSQGLEKLAQAQSREAEVLAAIAEHYSADQNERQSDTSTTLERLAQERLAQEQQAQLFAREQAFQQAEALAELSAADPRELLRRLEQELPQNEAMQEELTDIAQALSQQSQRSLQNAADRERQLEQGLERSDVRREPLRQEFQQELNQTLAEAERVARRLQREAQNEAEQGGQESVQQQLQESARELLESVDEARTLAESGLNRDLKAAAEMLQQSLQKTQPQVQEAADSLGQAKSQNLYDNEQRQANARNQANRTQEQTANQDRQQADRTIQQREQQSRSAQQAIDRAQQEQQQAEQQLKQSRERLDSRPDDQWAQQQASEAEARIQQSQSVKSVLEAIRDRANQRLEAARQERQALENRPPEIQAANPHSELGERLSQQAQQRASELSRELGELLDTTEFMAQTEAARQEAAQANRQQGNVQEQVAEAARDLNRAANHQARLNAPQSAAALQEAAQRVSETANREPQTARQQLERAAEASPGSPQPLTVPSVETQAAQESLQASQQALQQRADELGQMLEQSSQATTQNENAANQQAANQQANNQQAANPQPAQPNQGNSENQNGQNARSQSQSQSQGSANSSGNDPLAQMGSRQKAELLDQLERELQNSDSASSLQSSAPSSAQSGSQPNNRPSSDRNPRGNQTPPALQNAMQSVNQRLQQLRSSSMSQDSNATSQASPTSARVSSGTTMAGPPGSGAVQAISSNALSAEPIGAWSRFREKKSDEVVESQRESVAPRYRRQIENYFKVLSEKSRVIE